MKTEDDGIPLVVWLEKLRDREDRAALAKLRRGLGKRMGTPEMYPYVVPFLPKERRNEDLYFLVASLFALHPDAAPRGRGMGEVFRKIGGGDASESIEKRFVHLLSAHREDVADTLRQAVSLAKSKDVAVDYHQLMADLLRWDHPDRYVQLRWAKDYWGHAESTGLQTQ